MFKYNIKQSLPQNSAFYIENFRGIKIIIKIIGRGLHVLFILFNKKDASKGIYHKFTLLAVACIYPIYSESHPSKHCKPRGGNLGVILVQV